MVYKRDLKLISLFKEGINLSRGIIIHQYDQLKRFGDRVNCLIGDKRVIEFYDTL